MISNAHSELKGQHALLSPSNYHWIRYDEEKLINYIHALEAKEMGTRLHALAEELISLRQKLPKTNNTLNMYVNDAIGFKMTPEVVLYYSNNCFGTADAISFRSRTLRIHDFKSGKNPASMDQLYIYASLFCLQEKYKPSEIDIELRIYQNDEVRIDKPTPDIILPIIDKIIRLDKAINDLNK